jgi:hypothetical protein
MRKLLISVFALLPLGLMAEDKPQFTLIGDVSQKVAYTAQAWDSPEQVGWLFQADLKPKFTFGPVSFTADTTWYLPLDASLTPDKPQVTIYEAYFRVTPVESLDLTFGQKHYNIGVGQIFTVGDTINPAIGFFDQKTGFRGATAEWSPVSWASVSGAYSTGTSSSATVKPDQGEGAGQFSVLLDKLQLTASAVAGKNTLNPAVGTSYDLGGVILTGEGAAEFRPDGNAVSTPRLSGSTGARWTVTVTDDWDLTLAAQYLYWANAYGAAGASDPAARGIAHEKNAFFQLQVTGGTEFSLATLVIIDLEDHSVLHQTVVTWTPWDNVDFVATLQTADGGTGDAWQYVRDPVSQQTYKYVASLAATYHF